MSFSSSFSEDTNGIASNKTGTSNSYKQEQSIVGVQTERLEQLQKQAREHAEIKHAAMKATRPTRVYCNPKHSSRSAKPKRVLTKRELSSKRSAEICRIKSQIYTELLEQSIVEEEQRQNDLRLKLNQLQNKSDALKSEIVDCERSGFAKNIDCQQDSCVQISNFDNPSLSFDANFGDLLNGSFVNEVLVSDDVPSFFKNDQLEECGYLSALSSDMDVCTKQDLDSNIEDYSMCDKLNQANLNENINRNVFSPSTIICVSDLPCMSPMKQVSSIRNFQQIPFSNLAD